MAGERRNEMGRYSGPDADTSSDIYPLTCAERLERLRRGLSSKPNPSVYRPIGDIPSDETYPQP